MSGIIYISLFVLSALVIGFVSFLVGLVLSIGDDGYVSSVWAFAWFITVIIAACELIYIL